MLKISKYIFVDLIGSKVILGYFLLMILSGWGIFMMESQGEKAFLMLLQLTLFALPLITLIFSTIYYYNSREFILLILSQPIKRSQIIGGIYVGLSTVLSIAYLVGVGLPLILYYPGSETLRLLSVGILLTMCFVAIALFISINAQDKSKGIGVALLIWTFLAFLFDGLNLFLMYQFAQYPIEDLILTISFFNPISIGRILVIMQTEASALFGLSGAIFLEFFGSLKGTIISYSILALWIIIPFFLSRKIFLSKDL